MDRARTNIETLTRCRAILKQLQEEVSGAILNSSSKFKENFPGVDENYQRDLTIYMEYLESLQLALSTFVDENDKALEDRIRNITAYNQTAYRKRNIL